MEVKYIVIDLSKIDGDKLSEMLEKAYKDGYQKGRECIESINAPTKIINTISILVSPFNSQIKPSIYGDFITFCIDICVCKALEIPLSDIHLGISEYF